MLSKKFSDTEFKLSNCLYFEDHTIGIVSAKGDSNKFPNILKTLKSFDIVKKLEVVDKGEGYIYVRIHTYNEKKYETITFHAFKNNCFVLSSVILKGGKEIWNIGTDKRENLSSLYKDLQKLGKVELNSIQKSSIENSLTNQQRDVMNLAKELGYYEWPRRIAVTKLAKYFGLSKSTFVEHLRKAEAKVIMAS